MEARVAATVADPKGIVIRLEKSLFSLSTTALGVKKRVLTELNKSIAPAPTPVIDALL